MPPDADTPRERFGAARAGPREPAPVLTDLFDQLLFPRILRAGPAAARPERVLVAGAAVLAVGIAAISVHGDPAHPGLLSRLVTMLDLVFDGIAGAALRVDLFDLHERLRLLLLETPRQLFADAPIPTGALLLVIATSWALGGAFIARSAALELGRQIHLRPVRAFRFALSKGPSSLASVLFIPVVAVVLLALPAALGLLLAVPGLNVLGAILHGLGLIAALIAAFVLLVWLAAVWLIVPAVACDGADPFDATQRAMGMVLNRPISVVAHLLLAVVQGLVLVGIVWAVADLGTSMAGWAAGLLTETGEQIVHAGGVVTESTPTTEGLSISLIALWHTLPVLLTLSYAVSYAHTAGVAVYLNARQMVDGQEPNEIWMPDDPAGVTSPASAAADP